MREKKTILNNHSGFTLVEMIVVLVILAILAAILVPALLGYIDDAKTKQDILNAKNCLTAIQSELTKCYAKQSDKLSSSNKDIFGDTKASTNGNNVNATTTDFANNVLKLLDLETKPYAVMFAAGSYGDTNNSKHDCYTVALFMYQEKETSTPVYYYNGEWSTESFRKDGKRTDIVNSSAIMQVGSLKNRKVKYYFVYTPKNGTDGVNAVWRIIKNEN